MRSTGRALPLLPLLLTACDTEPKEVSPPPAVSTPDPTPAPLTSDHPLDRLLIPRFDAAGLRPELAGDAELCRRLSADLLGRFLTAEEVQAECAGRTVEEVARDFQSRDAYLLLSERHWRERMRTTDAIVDWRYSKDLYLLVDQLHAGRLPYQDFAREVLAHPGFLLTNFVPEEMAEHAFSTFFGRAPSKAEAAGAGALFRAWTAALEPDPDFPYIETIRAYVVPYYCELSACTTTLLGGATVSIPMRGNYYPRWEELDPFQKDSLGAVGELFTRQPMFWEAAADEILERYLGWSDGGRFPRDTGTLLPEVRQAVAAMLRESGDYPAAERLVLSSWLYRQTNARTGGAPVWAAGPLKPAPAEVWLDSLGAMTYGDLGTCDPRYPDYVGYALMYQAYMDGTIDMAKLAHDLSALHQLQEARIAMVPGDYGFLEPSGVYSYLAGMIGGCPGFGAQRQGVQSLGFAMGQEGLAELVCQPGIARKLEPERQTPSLENVLAHQMRQLYGREPRRDEVAAFAGAVQACSGEDCDRFGVARSVCTALAGSAEMLFY